MGTHFSVGKTVFPEDPIGTVRQRGMFFTAVGETINKMFSQGSCEGAEAFAPLLWNIFSSDIC